MNKLTGFALTLSACGATLLALPSQELPEQASCDLPVLVDWDFDDWANLPCDMDGTARLDLRFPLNTPRTSIFWAECPDRGGILFDDPDTGYAYCIGVDY